MTPSTFGWWLDEMVRRVDRPKVEYGVHVHNDFGMGVANTLTALEHGIPCVNTTVNGIGERAGNASFEELVMALEELYRVKTGIDKGALYALSRRVEEISGVPVAFNKAVVGYNAFTHESGIHTDGVIKNTLTYEPMQVEGLNRRRRFVFGKHTGTRAVEARLKEAGLNATKEQLVGIANEIKEYTENHTKEYVRDFITAYRKWDRDNKGVSPEVFWDIVRKQGLKVPTPIPVTV